MKTRTSDGSTLLKGRVRITTSTKVPIPAEAKVTDRYRLWQVSLPTPDITVESGCKQLDSWQLRQRPTGEIEMNKVWGLSMAAVGLFMLVSGTMKSEFVVYRLLVARSRILWLSLIHI